MRETCWKILDEFRSAGLFFGLLFVALVMIALTALAPSTTPREYPAHSTLIFRSGTTTRCAHGVSESPWERSYTCHQDDGDFTVAWRDVSAVKVPR